LAITLLVAVFDFAWTCSREDLFFADRPWSLDGARLAEALAVFFRPLEPLFLRADFADTTYAWYRHAPVRGFSGEPDAGYKRPSIGSNSFECAKNSTFTGKINDL